jgi:hypothetical protein
VTRPEEYTGADSDSNDGIENAQTIAAYFQQHDISSTRLIACNIDHVCRSPHMSVFITGSLRRT